MLGSCTTSSSGSRGVGIIAKDGAMVPTTLGAMAVSIASTPSSTTALVTWWASVSGLLFTATHVASGPGIVRGALGAFGGGEVLGELGKKTSAIVDSISEHSLGSISEAAFDKLTFRASGVVSDDGGRCGGGTVRCIGVIGGRCELSGIRNVGTSGTHSRAEEKTSKGKETLASAVRFSTEGESFLGGGARILRPDVASDAEGT